MDDGALRWDIDRDQLDKIEKIASRAGRELGSDVLRTSMDLTVCHLNGCPLDLEKLLDSPLGDFGHDVSGIRQFLDRTTGKLTECFFPRSAA